MLELASLQGYDTVILQCHNNPDADSIACGFALYCFFKEKGLAVKLVYGGFAEISKPNIAEFVRLLKIPLEYLKGGPATVTEFVPLAQNPLLITVDCQYGAGNLTPLYCPNVCVIDHHLPENTLPPLAAVEPYCGSCATVVWRLLQRAGYAVNANRAVATALYYGLYTDTNSLSELFHPVDRDMLEQLDFDEETIRWLKSNNLTRDELHIAANALLEANHDDIYGYTLFWARPCDPNILGFISDLTMQAQGVQVCVGFTQVGAGYKLSIRSTTNEVMANELAAYLTQGLGSGGGGREKAGGFFKLEEGQAPLAYLKKRMLAYYGSYSVIRAGVCQPRLEEFELYKKRPLPAGYVALAPLFAPGVQVVVRTLEGDAVFAVEENSYVMLGVEGEAYPIDREVFESRYSPLPGEFCLPEEVRTEDFYPPTVCEKLYGKTLALLEHARPCLPKGESYIYAKKLEKNTKVFAKWYKEGYLFGRPGDYLALRREDTSDAYIIAGRIFAATYQPG